MTVYVVLPVHNRIGMTLGFLDSLNQQTTSELVHVVVVDDGSTDGTAEAMADRVNVTVLAGDGSLWWAGAIDMAVAYLKPRLADTDWVYLANNDTVLNADHLEQLLVTAEQHPDALIGSVSFETWPDGHRHPVSTGFFTDPVTLEVTNLPGDTEEVTQVQALAGRGMLIPARAARLIVMHPRRMPQHFADLTMTNELRARGFTMLVNPKALADSTERAGSSAEIKARVTDMASKRSPLYLPAMWSFWWKQSTTGQRVTLPWRFARRGIRQATQGTYAVR